MCVVAESLFCTLRKSCFFVFFAKIAIFDPKFWGGAKFPKIAYFDKSAKIAKFAHFADDEFAEML